MLYNELLLLPKLPVARSSRGTLPTAVAATAKTNVSFARPHRQSDPLAKPLAARSDSGALPSAVTASTNGLITGSSHESVYPCLSPKLLFSSAVTAGTNGLITGTS